eukprot:12201025-Alexandrium_andersonii.AAC.1
MRECVGRLGERVYILCSLSCVADYKGGTRCKSTATPPAAAGPAPSPSVELSWRAQRSGASPSVEPAVGGRSTLRGVPER